MATKEKEVPAGLSTTERDTSGDEGKTYGVRPGQVVMCNSTTPGLGPETGLSTRQPAATGEQDSLLRLGGQTRYQMVGRDNPARMDAGVGSVGTQDPFGIAQHSPGAKLDAGKPDLSLLVMFGKALPEVGRVGTIGAKKYSRGGWQHVKDGFNRYTAAMLRHLFAEDESLVDDDTGMLHAAQVAWNALARLELLLRERDNKGEEE